QQGEIERNPRLRQGCGSHVSLFGGWGEGTHGIAGGIIRRAAPGGAARHARRAGTRRAFGAEGAEPQLDQKSMPPAGAGALSFLGSSPTQASVVRIRLAIEAAFCSAVRVTLVGSTTPSSTRSPYWPL